jgi:hypothetical protein
VQPLDDDGHDDQRKEQAQEIQCSRAHGQHRPSL